MCQLEYVYDVSLDLGLPTNKISDDSFVSGKNVYNPRDPSELCNRRHYKSYKYGTAWSLSYPAQQGAVAILCMHMLLALAHTSMLLVTGRSSEAWDSINELLILAYDSLPRPGAFDNCSGGVVHTHTLEKKVRIGTRTQYSGDVQAELVICDDENGAGRIVQLKRSLYGHW
ncbi:hypothetical protein K458DRAFT_401669 [Lentithecium fluviatile CBS 122367]|uniref:Uncharacterized protein n=1 Tax=Lentithecium fluviatile CBS 122367 TaxID=1168545 RepID=A0A6G1JAA3_9PLEO|nr:hypothetical protein K458DRAFT_401669 [Lentithecium fluviatile CBS 122367]